MSKQKVLELTKKIHAYANKAERPEDYLFDPKVNKARFVPPRFPLTWSEWLKQKKEG
jgi:hypothetical protein